MELYVILANNNCRKISSGFVFQEQKLDSLWVRLKMNWPKPREHSLKEVPRGGPQAQVLGISKALSLASLKLPYYICTIQSL